MNDVEEAGLVHRGMELKRRHKELTRQLAEAADSGNTAESAVIIAEMVRVESEFDVITLALVRSGTEQARAFVMRRMTINQDFDVISVLNRAKVVSKRAGKKFSEANRVILENMANSVQNVESELEVLKKKIDSIIAERIIKRGKANEYSSMAAKDRQTRMNESASLINELRKKGCN